MQMWNLSNYFQQMIYTWVSSFPFLSDTNQLIHTFIPSSPPHTSATQFQACAYGARILFRTAVQMAFLPSNLSGNIMNSRPICHSIYIKLEIWNLQFKLEILEINQDKLTNDKLWSNNLKVALISLMGHNMLIFQARFTHWPDSIETLVCDLPGSSPGSPFAPCVARISESCSAQSS